MGHRLSKEKKLWRSENSKFQSLNKTNNVIMYIYLSHSDKQISNNEYNNVWKGYVKTNHKQKAEINVLILLAMDEKINKILKI